MSHDERWQSGYDERVMVRCFKASETNEHCIAVKAISMGTEY